MRRIVVAMLVTGLGVVGCASETDTEEAATRTSPSATSPDQPAASTPTADTTTAAADSWSVGPADEYRSLSVAFTDDGGDDARQWAEWLGCDALPNDPGGPSMHGCLVDTGHGEVVGVVVDWYAQDDALDAPSAILAQQFGGPEVYRGFCAGESVTTASLAPGYAFAIFDDRDHDPEVRYDTAVDVGDELRRAAAISGLDAEHVDAVGTVDVHRCSSE